jgi:hypothetical protein
MAGAVGLGWLVQWRHRGVGRENEDEDGDGGSRLGSLGGLKEGGDA